MAPNSSKVEPSSENEDNESCKSDDTLSDYCLEWLFDESRMDHLSIEEQLDLYEQRDLRKVKIYKIATQIWGAKTKRKRVFVAPPMYKKAHESADAIINTKPINAELKPQKPPPKQPSEAEIKAREQQGKIDDYKKWFAGRIKFRQDLESMGLQEDWLASKPDRTPLEQRVLTKMIKDRTPIAPSPPPIVDVPLQAIMADESPTIKRPSPLAIHILEQFLAENKLRVLDLFSSTDKDKDWQVTREEFRQAVRQAKIPISDTLLEDLILALDTDLNDTLDYRELAKGMGLWKIEKRESKRKIKGSASGLSAYKLSQMSGFESPDLAPSLDSITQIGRHSSSTVAASCVEHENLEQVQAGNSESRSSPLQPIRQDSEDGVSPAPQANATRVKSAISTISSRSSALLTPPPLDTRQERLMYGSEEAEVDQRKRNKDILRIQQQRNKKAGSKKMVKPINTGSRSTVINTGEKAIDDHCAPSTLGGETADQVDKFRQLKLREFNEICSLCHSNNMILNKDLLEKVLLYPKDRTVKTMKKNVRQPGSDLPSACVSEPPKRPKSPAPALIKTKERRMKVTSSGRIMTEGGPNSYPSQRSVQPVYHKMNLSTGKAHIKRQVDCWMSFEEYDALTKNLAQKFTDIHGTSNDNAFWPGHLLSKIRLYMPNVEPKSATMFNSVKQEKKVYPGFDNNLRGWPQNNAGYVQIGVVDPYSRQNIF